MGNKKPYLISIDLDGTLLNDKKSIPLRTIFYLRKLQKKGNIIVLTTGRPPRTCLKYYKKIGLKSPLICHNGALVYNPTDKNFKPIIHPINIDDAKEIYKTLKEEYFESCFLESVDSIYYDKEEYFTFTTNDNRPDKSKVFIGDIEKNLNQDPLVFVVHSKLNSDTNISKAYEYIEKRYKNLEITVWGSKDYFDIHPVNINKATTIRIIMEHYDILEDNVLTFGDSNNDIDLVTSFKNGFAMINANEKLKNHAKKFTKKDNNHQGVAFEIKNFLKD